MPLMLKKWGMEQIFKQNLLTLRNPENPKTFSDALFPNSLWKPLKKTPVSKPKTDILISDEYSEKKQVLESFERFAQEKIKESPSGVVEIQGGELAQKSIATWEASADLSSLTLPSQFLDVIVKNKKPGKVQAIFVTETFRNWEEVEKDLKEGLINELLVGFPQKTAEFFERMILAMKLMPDEVLLYPVEFAGKDFSSEVITIAAHFRPEVIITLGAKATQKILKVNDRLTLIHGQFFARELEDGHSFQVVPLFHPSIIETNQNMKKTAWTDMQKIMKHLKKLP